MMFSNKGKSKNNGFVYDLVYEMEIPPNKKESFSVVFLDDSDQSATINCQRFFDEEERKTLISLSCVETGLQIFFDNKKTFQNSMK